MRVYDNGKTMCRDVPLMAHNTLITSFIDDILSYVALFIVCDSLFKPLAMATLAFFTNNLRVMSWRRIFVAIHDAAA